MLAFQTPQPTATAHRYRATHAPASPAQQGARPGITEVILSEFSADKYDILLPMLAQLTNSHCDRWLTWIAPRGITRELLQRFGFDLTRLRIIHASEDRDNLWMFWDALNNGCSHTVVATAEQLSKKDCEYLEEAAANGEARGIVLSHRH